MSTDLIRAEQYLDFVRNRTFRRTLLCHREAELRRPPSPQAVKSMHLTGLARPLAPDADPTTAEPEEFQTASGTKITTNHPLLKAALHVLGRRWPRTVPFAELWGEARRRLAEAGAAEAAWNDDAVEVLAEGMLQSYLGSLVELHVEPSRFVAQAGERPRASPLARHQAAAGAPVTNFRHRNCEVNDLDRTVLRHLDGAHDRGDLLRLLAGAVERGELEVQHQGRAVRDAAALRPALEQGLDAALRRLAEWAMLEG
jgi:methyltransferase-like protein